MDGQGDWLVSMDGYSVNGVVTKGETKVIPDTGTLNHPMLSIIFSSMSNL